MVKVPRGYRSKRTEYRGSAGGGRSGAGGFPMGKAGAGAGGLGIIGVIVTVIMGLLGGGGTGAAVGLDSGSSTSLGASAPTSGEVAPGNDLLEFVFDDSVDTWNAIFQDSGRTDWRDPGLVFYLDSVSTDGCGAASAAVGPFYCPAPTDEKVYIDQSFMDQLATRFGAPGDFAQAYVVAHEVGHHVSKVLGVSDEVRQLQQQQPGNANEYSVRLELQADCFAGVWAYTANERGILEAGDLEEGLTAANAVGDDVLQAQQPGGPQPHTYTHGTGAQRIHWFRIGFESGNASNCDTFAVDNLG